MTDLATRLLDGMERELHALFAPGSQTRVATRTALAAVVSLLAALWLHLDEPWWAAITGFAVVQQNASATVTRSIDRAAGTILGAVIGYLGAAAIADHLLFQLICGTCTATAVYGQERIDHGYALLLGGVTAILVMFGALAEPSMALHLAVYRALEILVGVTVASAIDYGLGEPASSATLKSQYPGIWTLPLDRPLLAIAISGGVAIALIPVIWDALDLPGLAQTPITAFVILTAMRHEPGWKAITRLSGCIFGAIYGLSAMHFVGDAFLPWMCALSLGLFVCAHVYRGGGDASYVGLQAGVAVIMAMIQGTAPSVDLQPVLDRLIGIFGGVVVVALCHPVLVPLVSRLLEPLSMKGRPTGGP